jgi:hypothetical protein
MDAVPERWKIVILECRPGSMYTKRLHQAAHPRPERFWPVDALELEAQLVFRRNLSCSCIPLLEVIGIAPLLPLFLRMERAFSTLTAMEYVPGELKTPELFRVALRNYMPGSES